MLSRGLGGDEGREWIGNGRSDRQCLNAFRYESDGDFIKAQIPVSSRETLVEPMPVLHPPSTTEEGGLGRGVVGAAGGSRSLMEGDSVRREGRIL